MDFRNSVDDLADLGEAEAAVLLRAGEARAILVR